MIFIFPKIPAFTMRRLSKICQKKITLSLPGLFSLEVDVIIRLPEISCQRGKFFIIIKIENFL